MITYHCSECGEQVEEFCAAHPKARVDSVVSHRSGPNLSEARRRELGYGAVKLRLPLDAIDHLTELADAAGLSRAEEAAEIIDGAWRAWKRKR